MRHNLGTPHQAVISISLAPGYVSTRGSLTDSRRRIAPYTWICLLHECHFNVTHREITVVRRFSWDDFELFIRTGMSFVDSC